MLTSEFDQTADGIIYYWQNEQQGLAGITNIAYIYYANTNEASQTIAENIITKTKGGKILKKVALKEIKNPIYVIAFSDFVRPSDFVDFEKMCIKTTKNEYEFVKNQWVEFQDFEKVLIEYIKKFV